MEKNHPLLGVKFGHTPECAEMAQHVGAADHHNWPSNLNLKKILRKVCGPERLRLSATASAKKPAASAQRVSAYPPLL
jgi:hypothetical protein